MALSIEDIKKVAHLARLEISDADASATLTKLSGILRLIEQMQAVDTNGIVTKWHTQHLSQRQRNDIVMKTYQWKKKKKNAPVLGNGSTESAVAEGLYLVPKVIE